LDYLLKGGGHFGVGGERLKNVLVEDGKLELVDGQNVLAELGRLRVKQRSRHFIIIK